MDDAEQTGATFDRLCEVDPRIRQLERDVIEFAGVYCRKRRRCANAAWYGYGEYEGKGFKPRLLSLVGWARDWPGKPSEWPDKPSESGFKFYTCDELADHWKDEQKALDEYIASLPEAEQAAEDLLRSHVAYDVVYQHLYDLLPDCRGCACL